MLPLMLSAPTGVTVLALDTPGNGLSPALALAEPTADDYADALAATLDALGVARVVVYGTHTGAAFGMALALRYPHRVAALLLDGIGAFSAPERAQLLASYLPPFVPLNDGTHMAWLWSRVRDQATFFPWNHSTHDARLWVPLPSPLSLHAVALDFLLSGDAYRGPYAAAFRFQPAAVLSQLRVPTWVAAREGDVLLSHLNRLPTLALPVFRSSLPPKGSAWAQKVWVWLAEAAQGLEAVPPARDATLPVSSIGDTLIGPLGRRIHARGALGGTGRPRIWLHASPGGARGLDRRLESELGQHPVVALDLPGHGESDAYDGTLEELLVAMRDAASSLGLPDAEWAGEGLGADIARALNGSKAVAGPEVATPARFEPRADGGHLMAAWLHARDEAVFGSWWTRRLDDRHSCGDTLDLATIHANAIESLKETPEAARLRSQWLALRGVR